MKDKILKILEDSCSKGYDDLHFEKDREYIANAIIESGNLIDLPCKLGGYVYDIYYKKPRAWKVVGFWINELGEFDLHIVWRNNGEFRQSLAIDSKHLGKCFYLTKAEAEAKLKEQQNESNNL